MSKILFQNQSADGNSAEVILKSQDNVYIHLSGNLGGGTVSIEGSVDGLPFVPIDIPDFTEVGMKLFQRGATSIKVRAVLSDSTGADVTLVITE